MKTLYEMLQHRRPASSQGELDFITEFIDSVSGMQEDEYGNRFLKIGKSKTMFCCHTDTVHYTDAPQHIFKDKIKQHLFAVDKTTLKPSILGADDAAGVWLMLKMIEAKVPGLYVFHQEEELGGQGSSFIADQNPEFLEGIERAIAFDRRGTQDIITHQAGGRCCSDEFAKEIALGLGMQHKPSSRGVFTDTANYIYSIPECTNISVGYENEHTNKEFLNYDYLNKLSKACIVFNWENLGTYKKVSKEFDYNTKILQTYDGRYQYLNYQDAEILINENPETIAYLLTEIYQCTHEDILDAEYYLGNNYLNEVEYGE